MFEGGENQAPNRFLQAFGRDANGNVYVLASRTGRFTSEAGEVYRLVHAGDGDEISGPEVETTEDAAGKEAAEDGDDGGEEAE